MFGIAVVVIRSSVSPGRGAHILVNLLLLLVSEGELRDDALIQTWISLIQFTRVGHMLL